jgi:hypothetical protein
MQTNNRADHRRWERHPITIPISLAKDTENLTVDNSATIIDMSLRGVGVVTTLALVPGDYVNVFAKGEIPDAIPTRVVWVREDESSLSIVAGLEFLGAEILGARRR